MATTSILDVLGEEVTGIAAPVSICIALTVVLIRILNPNGKSDRSVFIATVFYAEKVGSSRRWRRASTPSAIVGDVLPPTDLVVRAAGGHGRAEKCWRSGERCGVRGCRHGHDLSTGMAVQKVLLRASVLSELPVSMSAGFDRRQPCRGRVP